MKLKLIITLCLLTVSTLSLSNSKWLRYGDRMFNLDTIGVITKGTTVHKEMYEDLQTTLSVAMLMGLDTSSILNPPDDRCYEGISWTYRLWVNSLKIKDYLPAYSTYQDPNGTLLSLRDGYSDITSYDTFKNWFFYKNPYTELSISKVEYDEWLHNDDIPNEIIEDTFNFKQPYIVNTVPMYHNSILFDDTPLWISGLDCNHNLVSSVSESDQLIQDTLSKIGKFISSDKDYLELF